MEDWVCRDPPPTAARSCAPTKAPTSKRHGTLDLFAALEMATGQVKTAITPFEAARGISSVHGPGRGANSRRPARNFPASDGEGANDEDVLLIEEIARAPTRHCRLAMCYKSCYNLATITSYLTVGYNAPPA